MRFINIAGYIAIPLAFVVHYLLGTHEDHPGKPWEPIATFILAALGVIPLAHMMGHATEHLAVRTGPTWGGLINATFGNMAELIIGIIALSKGLTAMVQASLTGSILGNMLLVAGAAMLTGGWKREQQTFNRATAEANGGMLALAVAALLFPAIFHSTAEKLHDMQLSLHERNVSIGVSLVLIVVYALGLLFTLRTHAHLFPRPPRKKA